MGASGLLKPVFGDLYTIGQLQFMILITVFFYVIKRGFCANQGLMLACVAFLTVGFYEYTVTYALNGYKLIALQQFLFGFFIPVSIILILNRMSEDGRAVFFQYFYRGYCVYLFAAVFILFFIDEKFYQQYDSYGLGGAIISLRYQFDDSLFMLILGNSNKQSNYLIILILLGPYLLNLKLMSPHLAEKPNLTYIVFVVLAVVVLTLLFSRAAIFLLPIALYINRRYLIKISLSIKLFLMLMILVLVINFIDSIGVVLDYLLFSNYVDGSSGGGVGSFIQRAEQWDAVFNLILMPDVFAHGLGLGVYGIMIGGGVEAGTHNLFLDHWLASGFFGVFLIISLVICGAVLTIIRREWRLFFGYVFFVLFALREYSFSYLYVTSMGGLCFALLILLTFGGTHTRLTEIPSRRGVV